MQQFKLKLAKYICQTEDKMKRMQEEINNLKRENALLKGQQATNCDT